MTHNNRKYDEQNNAKDQTEVHKRNKSEGGQVNRWTNNRFKQSRVDQQIVHSAKLDEESEDEDSTEEVEIIETPTETSKPVGKVKKKQRRKR